MPLPKTLRAATWPSRRFPAVRPPRRRRPVLPSAKPAGVERAIDVAATTDTKKKPVAKKRSPLPRRRPLPRSSRSDSRNPDPPVAPSHGRIRVGLHAMTAAAAAIRTAGPGDAAAIAALHARSWRAAYRGILPDTYLDGPLLADRTVYWQAALALSDPGLVVLVLEGTPGMAGFAAARIPDPDGYGACIDNLHLAPNYAGKARDERCSVPWLAAWPGWASAMPACGCSTATIRLGASMPGSAGSPATAGSTSLPAGGFPTGGSSFRAWRRWLNAARQNRHGEIYGTAQAGRPLLLAVILEGELNA